MFAPVWIFCGEEVWPRS